MSAVRFRPAAPLKFEALQRLQGFFIMGIWWSFTAGVTRREKSAFRHGSAKSLKPYRDSLSGPSAEPAGVTTASPGERTEEDAGRRGQECVDTRVPADVGDPGNPLAEAAPIASASGGEC